MPVSVLGVIPARYASSRFPGKPLANLAGKPVLQHVFERAREARYLNELVIATDDERIRDAARMFHAPAIMTRSDHVSGTDRVAEAASAFEARLIVNIQGDEPLLDPAAIDAATLAILDDSSIPMTTLKKRIEHPADNENPNVVKVVTDRHGNALYFSRRPIPYDWDEAAGGKAPPRYKHIGLYAYRREFLLGYSKMPIGPLEKAERLEQLRALENGHAIRVVETDCESLGVDTPEDLARVSELFAISAGRGST